MSAHIQQAGLLTGRQVTLLVVIGLHALIITGLIAIKVVPPMMDAGPPPFIIEFDRITPVPPPELILKRAEPVKTAPVLMPMPIIAIPIDDATPVVAAQVMDTAIPSDAGAGPDVGAPTGTGTAVAPLTHVSTELKYQMIRSSDEYYPDASVRAEERGIAIVRVCVNASGKIDGAPTILATSGFRRLDQAALRWARESLRFTPATEDGVAVAACKGFRVNFALR